MLLMWEPRSTHSVNKHGKDWKIGADATSIATSSPLQDTASNSADSLHPELFSSSSWAYLLSDCDALDVGPKVKPQSQQARQRLEDVPVTIMHSQTIVTNDLR